MYIYLCGYSRLALFPLFFIFSRSLAPVSFHEYSMVFVHDGDDDYDGGGGCCCFAVVVSIHPLYLVNP